MKTMLIKVWLYLLISAANISYCEEQPSLSSVIKDDFNTFMAQVTNYINAKEPVPLSDLPLLASIPMAPAVKKFFNAIKISVPKLDMTDDYWRLSGQAEVNGALIEVYFERVLRGLGAKYDIFYVKFPGIGTLSQLLYRVCGIKPFNQILPFIKQKVPNFKINSVLDVELLNTFLVVASDRVESKQFGEVLKGVNILSNIRLKGLEKPLSKFFNTDLNHVVLRGTLAPTISGSSLSVVLPGGINIAQGINTTPVTFGISLNSLSVALPYIIIPGLFWRCGYTVTPQFLPLLKESVSFEAMASITPQGAEITHMMTGMIDKVFPGLDVGDAGMAINVDWGILAATGVPISGFSVRGRARFMQKDIEIGSKVSFTAAGGIENLVLIGSLKGSISLEEMIRTGAEVINFHQAGSSSAVDLNARIKPEDIPTLKIENPRFVFVFNDAMVAGKNYSKGMEISGKVSILGAYGEIELIVIPYGIKGFAKISPIVIKHPLNNAVLLSITSAEFPQEGPKVFLEYTPVNTQVLIDGYTRINVLGEVSSKTLYKMSLSTIEGKFSTKIFNLYESDVEVKGDISTIFSQGLSPDNYYMTITLNQSGLSNLASRMVDVARNFNPGFDVKAQAELDRVTQEIMRLESERNREYATCTGPQWNWSWMRCRLFWGEIVKRQAAMDALVFYRDALLKPGASLVQGAITAASDITQFAASVINKGINIKHFSSQARLSELLQSGTLPRVSISAGFMGRDIELKDIQFSFSDIQASLKNILEQLKLSFR